MNHLAGAASPYLRLHAEQDIDWWPYGDDAREEAERRACPILISIGYMACHWCHVMAHEAFADPGTVRFLNDHFVAIKVDREELPEIDASYMSAMNALGLGGGWPLTVIAAPDGTPFAGGKYFPASKRHGLPSLLDVLQEAVDAWTSSRDEIATLRLTVRDHLARKLQSTTPSTSASHELPVQEVIDAVARVEDREHGGFGGGAKFPHAQLVDLLLTWGIRDGREDARHIAHHAIDALVYGGIRDLVSGGMHRYTVDPAWRIPHFEKMLYDQALMGRLLIHASQVSWTEEYSMTAQGIARCMDAQFLLPQGGFASSLDADTAGGEGAYYTWSEEEFRHVVGERADRVAPYLGIGDPSSKASRGAYVVTWKRDIPDELLSDVYLALSDLAAVRFERQKPARGELLIVDWNALGALFMVEAGLCFSNERYLDLAHDTCSRILKEATDGVRVYHTPRSSAGTTPLRLRDAALVVEALIRAGGAVGDGRAIERAYAIASDMCTRFRTPERGFMDTDTPVPPFGLRNSTYSDESIPSPVAAAFSALDLVIRITGDAALRTVLEEERARIPRNVFQDPVAHASLIAACDAMDHLPREIIITGPMNDQVFSPMRMAVGHQFSPNEILLAGVEGPWEILQGRSSDGDSVRAFVCEGGMCSAPAVLPGALQELLH